MERAFTTVCGQTNKLKGCVVANPMIARRAALLSCGVQQMRIQKKVTAERLICGIRILLDEVIKRNGLSPYMKALVEETQNRVKSIDGYSHMELLVRDLSSVAKELLDEVIRRNGLSASMKRIVDRTQRVFAPDVSAETFLVTVKRFVDAVASRGSLTPLMRSFVRDIQKILETEQSVFKTPSMISLVLGARELFDALMQRTYTTPSMKALLEDARELIESAEGEIQ